jgi:regulatory protein
LIQKALKSIPEDEYQTTFENLSAYVWNQIKEPSAMRKKKKFVDTLLRKGYEQDLIFEQYAHFTKNK